VFDTPGLDDVSIDYMCRHDVSSDYMCMYDVSIDYMCPYVTELSLTDCSQLLNLQFLPGTWPWASRG